MKEKLTLISKNMEGLHAQAEKSNEEIRDTVSQIMKTIETRNVTVISD